MSDSKDKDNELMSQLYLKDKRFKVIRRKQFIRLTITYILPYLILLTYFYYELNQQYNRNCEKNLHSITENKTHFLETYFNEKIQAIKIASEIAINSSNYGLQDNNSALSVLTVTDKLFQDIHLVDKKGNIISSSGNKNIIKLENEIPEIIGKLLNNGRNEPLILRKIDNSSNKTFFIALKIRKKSDIYIAIASLNTDMIDNILFKFKSQDIYSFAIIENEGYKIISSTLKNKNNEKLNINLPKKAIYSYRILKIDNFNYKVTIQQMSSIGLKLAVFYKEQTSLIPALNTGIITMSIIILFILLGIVFYRANKIAQLRIEKDITRNQLEQASKLASIGELVSGIAHEINNPLAIIATEVGLIKDMTNPVFNYDFSIEKMAPHLQSIHDATFRGRDITKKLLSFVRNDKIEMKEHDINQVIDDLIDDFFKRELESSNIKIERYSNDKIPALVTESNQLKQVLINIINNSVDAITPPGVILLETSYDEKFVIIAITDTGKGIKEEDMNKIFMPFYTSKDVGKGTGLGLSVSYGIIKNLGGVIEVESVLDTGTTFIIKLPY